jgi:hypothetical protein
MARRSSPVLRIGLYSHEGSNLRCCAAKTPGLEKGSEIETEEGSKQRSKDVGGYGGVIVSRSPIRPHAPRLTASEGPVKIGGVSGLWARPGGLAACGKRVSKLNRGDEKGKRV